MAGTAAPIFSTTGLVRGSGGMASATPTLVFTVSGTGTLTASGALIGTAPMVFSPHTRVLSQISGVAIPMVFTLSPAIWERPPPSDGSHRVSPVRQRVSPSVRVRRAGPSSVKPRKVQY